MIEEPMHLLDTNICITINRGNQSAIAEFSKNAKYSYICTVNLAELYKGVYCSQQIAKNLADLNNLLSLLSVVDVDRNAALEFGIIQGELRKLGKPTSVFDALIAAVARSRNDILVTDNTKDFQNIPDLQLENWLNP